MPQSGQISSRCTSMLPSLAMVTSRLRLLWALIVKLARIANRVSLGLIWKIYQSLVRGIANLRGHVPQAETRNPGASSDTSVEGTIPAITIRETTPTAFSTTRYEKSVPDFSPSDMLIPAGHPSKLNFDPEGWRQLSQPEGQPYYYHVQHRIVTESNVTDINIRREVEEIHHSLTLHTQRLRSFNPISTELFINVQNDDKSYYLVDHKENTIFWLKPLRSKTLNLKPVLSEKHMTLQRESLYWSHVETFPMHHAEYPVDSEDCLLSVLNQELLDGITCRTSTATNSPEECERFIKILKNYKKKDGYRLWSLDIISASIRTADIMLTVSSSARLWTFILNNRFFNLHGQQPARLHRLARLTKNFTPPVPLMLKLILGASFFNAYQGHINSLEDIYVDGVAYKQHWRSFLEERLREWNAVTLVATVLWTVGVGLLQVMLGSTDSTSALIRDLVVASTFCAMTSTVISLLHERQHRRRAKDDGASQAAEYLYRHYDPKRGFLFLAILYCLPYVLLLWGFLLAAIATLVFGLMSGRAVVAAVAAVMSVAIMVTVLTWNWKGSISAVGWPGQWETKYLLLMKKAATRLFYSTNSPPLAVGQITSDAPHQAESHTP